MPSLFRLTAIAARIASAALVAPIGCREYPLNSPKTVTARQMSERLLVSAPITESEPQVSRAADDHDGVARSPTLSSHAQFNNDDSDVWVSLPPGSIPSGESATIRNLATGQSVVVVMAMGGFDPVPLRASAGDTFEAEIHARGRIP